MARKYGMNGQSVGSLTPRTDIHYDRIKTPADLVPDASLRREGTVMDQDGQPVAGAPVGNMPAPKATCPDFGGGAKPASAQTGQYRGQPFFYALVGLPTLVDDRSRRFTGLTLKRAFKKAERAQDPRDPIHHPPFPDPREVPEP